MEVHDRSSSAKLVDANCKPPYVLCFVVRRRGREELHGIHNQNFPGTNL